MVIPTLNAGVAFAELLAALNSQTVGAEIVVVDSGSTDGTAERAAEAGARVHRIETSEFNHGRTRNLGVSLSNGDFIAFLTQDALPRDARWLPGLLAPFEDDAVAGVYSRVAPRIDASLLVRRSIAGDLVSGEKKLYKRLEDAGRWVGTPPSEKRAFAHFNNVSSCVRRDAIERFPFPELSFGEDVAWGLAMLEAGEALVYAPDTVVVHSHVSSLRADFARHRADSRLLQTLFGLQPSLRQEIGALTSELHADFAVLWRCGFGEFLRYAFYSPLLRGVQAFGRAVGSREGVGAADRAALERGGLRKSDLFFTRTQEQIR